MTNTGAMTNTAPEPRAVDAAAPVAGASASPRTEPTYACLADGSPDPDKFPDFVAESFASWQLTRATAWAVVALLARFHGHAGQRDDGRRQLADAALVAASDRALSALISSVPAGGGLAAEYAPALALYTLLAQRAPGGDRGWIDEVTPDLRDPSHYASEPELANVMKALAEVRDNTAAAPAKAP
jgi:hypothetical protein